MGSEMEVHLLKSTCDTLIIFERLREASEMGENKGELFANSVRNVRSCMQCVY